MMHRQALSCRIIVSVYFKCAALNVDGDEFTLLISRNIWANVALLDGLSALRKFLFAIDWL
jgi:hypothetical protein